MFKALSRWEKMIKIWKHCTKSLHMRSFMPIKKHRIHFAAVVCFCHVSILANILHDVKQRRKFHALRTNLKMHSPQNDLAKICMKFTVFHWKYWIFLRFHSNVWLWQIYLPYISLVCDLNFNSWIIDRYQRKKCGTTIWG